VSRVLVVEDEPRIASFVVKGLRASGFTAEVAATGADALAAIPGGAFDLVVLDLGLPDMDGLDVLRRLRRGGNATPVLVLSARDAVEDRVGGLEGGADDYLVKPFSFAELLARVRVRLRDSGAAASAVLTAAGAELDLRTRRATVEGRSVELSAREFALAEVFFRHPGQVLSREQLLSQVWGYDHDPGSNIVEVYVGYLRRKLGRERIRSVRGMGYCLRST
jgi:DNA-binding response OmpR family regulator